VQVALRGETRTIDLGRVECDGTSRLFANVASAGMSGAVARRANTMTKRFGGRATFFYALTREFLAWQNTRVVVELDEGVRREGPMHDVIVANGRFHGGGMQLAPEARQDDGAFDVVTIGDVTKLDFLSTAPKLYSGRYLAHPKVELLRSSTAAVSSADPLPLEVDGEPIGSTPARFEVVPAALRLRVPAG
jgi:diacylglycerol kinase family enzyme